MSVAVRVGSRYLARAVIGHGSFGTVFRADSPDGPVAVKLLRPDLARNPEVVNRFLRERSVLLRLSHPGIVPVRDLVAERDVLALVMDLVDGHDLRARLTSQGAMLPVDAARLVGDVAAALSYAHHQGVVHRDVKPENVLLRGDGTPLLTDFGIARLVATAATVGGQDVLGTPAYLAPEIATGGAASSAADTYACGVLLYELVTGHPPFVAEHPLSVVHQHVTEAPRRPAGMPDGLWRVVEACLSKHPEDRPDADTVRLLLAEWAARPDSARHSGSRHTEVVVLPPEGETRQVPLVPVPRHSGTRVLPTVAGTVGRARPSAPVVPTPDPGAPWGPPAPARRSGWLLYGGALVGVAAVFLAAGFWLGDVTRDPAPGGPTADATNPSPRPSQQAEPQPRYLSDLPFVQVANGWGPVELNKSTGNIHPDDGGPLVLAGTTYERGLGVHAPSHVRIYPPKGCGTLKAVVGVDGSSQGPAGGTVSFQVHIDGQIRYDSGIVTRQDQPKPVEADVTGATTVDLIVTDAGDGNHWDIADWADAHLVCDG